MLLVLRWRQDELFLFQLAAIYQVSWRRKQAEGAKKEEDTILVCSVSPTLRCPLNYFKLPDICCPSSSQKQVQIHLALLTNSYLRPIVAVTEFCAVKTQHANNISFFFSGAHSCGFTSNKISLLHGNKHTNKRRTHCQQA